MTAIKEAIDSIEGKEESPLNGRIALLVALAATLMAIGNIKDGNIVQAMAQNQAKAVNAWSYYQSKSTKQIMAENMAEQLRIQLQFSAGAKAELVKPVETQIARYKEEAARYDKEKADIKKQAEGFQAEYDRLNLHDDQFDMAEACFSIAIALAGITALTRKKWLLTFSLSLTAIGIALELSGFLGWAFHPEWLAKVLG